MPSPAGPASPASDSTVICREGQQEGARKGYNPRRKGRNSQHPLLAVSAWTKVDENYSVGEIPVQLQGWSKTRRFIVVRERVRDDKAAVGRLLLDVPGYTFRVFSTKRTYAPEVIWRDYNGRACVEQRIEELKHDLSAGGFCVREFFGTEAAFLSVLFAFNLLGPYQRQLDPARPYRQPATLRSQVFVAGAILGLAGKQVALKLSQA